jgi:hypothetical protein
MTLTTVGRHKDNSVHIDHDSVSRYHAEIEDVGGGDYRLRDLGSTNGTFVKAGSEWIGTKDAVVGTGNIIRFGDVEFNVADLVDTDDVPKQSKPEAQVSAAPIPAENRAENMAERDVRQDVGRPDKSSDDAADAVSSSSEFTWQEDHVIDVFHVTGFFGSKAKPHVARSYAMVFRQIRDNSKAPGMGFDDLAEALMGLEGKGLITLDRAKSTAKLTDAGHVYVSAPGFAKRARFPVPTEAAKSRRRESNEGVLFGIAMGSGLGDGGD